MQSVELDLQHAFFPQRFITPGHLQRLAPRLEWARQQVLQDPNRWTPEQPEFDPLFFPWPEQALQEHRRQEGSGVLGQVFQVAQRLRQEVQTVVVLGIGGSYMGAWALLQACRGPFYNLLPPSRRQGPRVFFDGFNVDGQYTASLLEVLSGESDPWGLIVISKSGTTLETAVALRVYLEALQNHARKSGDLKHHLVVITGPQGPLGQLAQRWQAPRLEVPPGIGGRFSVLTPVGLLPAAVLGLNVVALLEGAAAMNRRFMQEPVGRNPVLDYAGVCHLWEQRQGVHIRVMASWTNALEGLGMWYDQLLAESLGKEEQGATPLTAVNTRDLHSRGQQHQQGRRDKLITNLVLTQPPGKLLRVPAWTEDLDGLNYLAGRSYADIMAAAVQGTNQAYAQDLRPTINLRLPELNEFTLGQVFQMLMLSTVVEGKLLGINPYGQPGVQQYKQNMVRILRQAGSGQV